MRNYIPPEDRHPGGGSRQHAGVLEHEHTQLGHVLDRVTDALAADSRVLDSAVRLRASELPYKEGARVSELPYEEGALVSE